MMMKLLCKPSVGVVPLLLIVASFSFDSVDCFIPSTLSSVTSRIRYDDIRKINIPRIQQPYKKHDVLSLSSFSEDLAAAAECRIGDDGCTPPKRKRRRVVKSLFLTSIQHEEWNIPRLTILAMLAGVGFASLNELAGIISTNMAHGSSLQESIGLIPSLAWDSYMSILTEHPIWTKACTSGAVYGIGDVISQRTETSNEEDSDRPIDEIRVLRSMIAGFIGHGPMSHFWYITCDSFFENVLHFTEWWSFLPKIGVDQMIWGPIWNNSYIILLGIMKRDSIGKMWSDVKTSTIPLVVSGLKLWPVAHVITYGFVPTENRLLWVDFVEILWVTILASQAASLSTTPPLPPSTESETSDSTVPNGVTEKP